MRLDKAFAKMQLAAVKGESMKLRNPTLHDDIVELREFAFLLYDVLREVCAYLETEVRK